MTTALLAMYQNDGLLPGRITGCWELGLHTPRGGSRPRPRVAFCDGVL